MDIYLLNKLKVFKVMDYSFINLIFFKRIIVMFLVIVNL